MAYFCQCISRWGLCCQSISITVTHSCSFLGSGVMYRCYNYTIFFIFITTRFTWMTVCHMITLYLVLRTDNALASPHIITSNDNGHIQKISAIWIPILALQFVILQTAQNYFVMCCVWARTMFCMSVWLQYDNCCFDMYLACALQIFILNCAFWWLSKHTFYYTLYANLYDIAQAYIFPS